MTPDRQQSRLLLVAAGGTIGTLRDAQTGRSVPGRSAADLLALTSVVAAGAVRPVDFSPPSGAYSHPDDLLVFARSLQREMADDLAGVVVTHGTDTVEEVAYFVDETLGARLPVVFTGAMRPGWAAGFDGVRNLENAFRVVRAAPAEYGVLVTMNDDIFEAWGVYKADTGALNAFAARRGAACGRVAGDLVEFAWRPVPRARFGTLPQALPARVPILTLGVADDAAFLEWVPDLAIHGLVVTTIGAGGVPPGARKRILTLAERGVPVVLCSSAAGGRTAEEYYYPGAYDDLTAAGVALEDRLPPRKARIRLMLSLATRVAYVPFGREFVAAPTDLRDLRP